MLDFTFLEEEQIFGDKRLEIFKKYGTKAAITDFSILLGGYVSSDIYTSEGNARKDRTGWWWTKSSEGDDSVRVVFKYGDSYWDYVNKCNGGARPAVSYSEIKSMVSNEIINKFGINEVEYGEYPQSIVDEGNSRELERAYNDRSLRATGKNYTTNSIIFHNTNRSFEARTRAEYEYKGRKYIRIVGNYNCDGKVLSDGRKVESGKPYWVSVEPVKWLIDEKSNIALSKKILFSGVQFKNTRDYKGDFENTDIKKFMDNYFSKEIVTDRIKEKKKHLTIVILENKIHIILVLMK